jgi:tryptophan-rich sensory protein
MTNVLPEAHPAAAPAGAARQAAVVGALAATLAVNVLANALPLNGQTTGEISDRFRLLITPPGYVFGIWGLIYTGLIGYAIYQALPAQRDDPRLRRVALPFILSCAANVAWLLLWHYNQYGLTLGAMLGLLLALITIDLRLGRVRGGALAERLLVRLPFSIYLGWVSVATIVNATVTLSAAGFGGGAVGPEAWTAGLLGVGAALGWAQARRGDVAYSLVLLWAFAGVAAKNSDLPVVYAAALAAAASAAASAAAAGLRERRKA